MSKITIDLVKLIEQVMPQVMGSGDFLPLQQWLGGHTGSTQAVTIELATVLIENELETTVPVPRPLRRRINDVTTFSDESELRVHVLAPRGSHEDLATDAYYGLLVAISNL